MTTEAASVARPQESHAVPTPASAGRVARFTRTERAVHWTQATTFLLLLISGFALSLPQFEAAIGHRELLREIHLTGAFFFFFGPAIIALSADRRSMGQDVDSVDTWDADDLRWLIPGPILRAFGVGSPPQGRFNAGQKLNAIFVVWCTLVFTVTGLILWQNRRFSIDLVSRANDIHTALAYIALLAFLGHLMLATVYPKTRPAFRAIVQGWVRRDWAEHHHAKWVRALMPPLPAPRYDALRATLQILLASAFCLFVVRVYFFELGANVTDKVTERLYAITAWPGAASIHPQTGIHIFDGAGALYALGCLVAWLALDRLRNSRPGAKPVAPDISA
jgi:formate dehydrogenase subunit gamma